MLVVTWCTAWALAPHRPRGPRPVAFSFWFSVAVNELPFLAAAWLAVNTLAAAVDGSLFSRAGYTVAGVAALTGCGLAVIAKRGGTRGPRSGERCTLTASRPRTRSGTAPAGRPWSA